MVDTRDLKSLGQKCPYGFDSRPRHKISIYKKQYIKKMRFGRYNVEKEDVDQYGWVYILPSIEVQHKYWYLWRITFSWLKWSCTICLIKDGWDAK